MTSAYPSLPAALPDTPVSRLVEQIKEAIRARRYAPGQRLIEAELASEYDTSRAPVREALRILAGDGIIELIPQKGARVRQLRVSDLRSLIPILAAMLRVTVQLSLRASLSADHKSTLEQAMQNMRLAAQAKNMEQFRLGGLAYTKILRSIAANPYLDYLDGKLYADLFYAQAGALTPIADWTSYSQSFEALHVAIVAGDQSAALNILDEQERAFLS